MRDDEILSLWRTVRPDYEQNRAMTYESGPYSILVPSAELRHLVELAVQDGRKQVERELAAKDAEIASLTAKLNATVQADPRQLWNVATVEMKERAEAAEAKIARLKAALAMAKCPDCDGSGVIPRQVSARQVVTHDMAMDAGSPELEGTPFTDNEWTADQCQWCDERKNLLEPGKEEQHG